MSVHLKVEADQLRRIFFFSDFCKRLPCMPSASGPQLEPIAHTHVSEISGDAQDNHRFDLARGAITSGVFAGL